MAAVPIPNTPHPTPLGEDPVLWLRLIRSRRVGPVTFHRLVDDHGGIAAALGALPGIAAAAGIANYESCPEGVAIAEMRQASRAGARMLRYGGAGYPALLAGLADAPPLLWVLGDAELLARPAVAVIGSRNASSLGLRMARRLAGALGEAGQVVVSGLARGIDAEAHRAALDTGTIAVVAGGVDVTYPDENAELTRALVKTGCILSEQPMGTQPQARHFPARNRIVSGLCSAVVVVEAAAGSGSLITARAALDQGREVMAVPGHPFDGRAAGCNQLIRDGALLVRGAQDVIEALVPIGHGRSAPPGPALQSDQPAPLAARGQGVTIQLTPRDTGAAKPASSGDGDPAGRPNSVGRSNGSLMPQSEGRGGAALSGPVSAPAPLAVAANLQHRILARLGATPLPEDQLIRDLALPAAIVSPALTALEIEGEVERYPGGLLGRRSGR